MRPERKSGSCARRAARAAAVCALLALSLPGATAAQITVPDSTSGPTPPATLPAEPAPASGVTVSPAVRDTAAEAVAEIARSGRVLLDFEEQRKRGDITWARALQARRPALVGRLPLFGPAQGSVSLPDAGSKLRPGPTVLESPAATDRPLFTAMEYGIGVLDLATALDEPRTDDVEMLDRMALRSGLPAGPFTRPGSLLSDPPGDNALARVMPGEGGRYRRARSALYYTNGESGELVAAARFLSPMLLRGVAGSYARHEADGVAPLRHSKSTRYALAAGLPRLLGQDLWIEGRSFAWSLEDEAVGNEPTTSALTAVSGRAELAHRFLAAHGSARGEAAESRWTARYGLAKRTSVEPGGRRERWEFPEAYAEWSGRLGPASGWSALGSARFRSQEISYRVDSLPLFAPRKEEARAGLGLRRSLGRESGLQADVAWDWREGESKLAEGRLSAWTEGSRFTGRLDLERAHERPSWIDLLTPERALTTPLLTGGAKTLSLLRAGNPALGPRRLEGALARVSYEISPALTIEAEGAARRLRDDFGWTLSRRDTPETLFVETRAGVRGSGWVSYGGLGARFRSGDFAARASGWVRGGSDALSPRAGLPPRFAGDLAVDIRVVFFQGDLPLQLGLTGHAEGPREGFVREPGWATLDAALRADFGALGAFAEMMNLFDRTVPSAVEDMTLGRGTPLPGRSLHLGVVWYLLD